MLVGIGAEAESEAVSNMVGLMRPWSALGIDPKRSIEAAADVVDAIACAVGGRGWLCWPTYVVINTLLSSAHFCTYKSYKGGLCIWSYEPSIQAMHSYKIS